MKRIYFLFLLIATSVSSAFAQRVVDLEVTIVKPTTSTVVNPGNTGFDIDVIVKNLGTDSLKSTTDSTLWYATIGTVPISWTFGSSSGTTWLRYNKGLKVNDTLHMTFNGLSFTNYVSTKDSNRNFCWYAFPVGKKPSDTIKDPVTTNNSKCVSFMFRKTTFPIGIGPVAGNASNYVMLYPNPAQNIANISFNTEASAEVKILVMDMAGRVVINENKGTIPAGNHTFPIDTKSLPNGTYSMQLYIGKEATTSKFIIEK